MQDSLETDDIGDQVVALDVIGKVPAAQNGGARRRARALVEYRLHFRMLARVVDVAGKRRRIIIDVARAIGDQILAPAIEHMAVRIGERIGDVDFELLSPRLIAIDARVGAALGRTVGRFDLRAVKHAFLKIQRPARIEHKAVGGVMRVGRIQPAQHALTIVRPAIARSVFQEE